MTGATWLGLVVAGLLGTSDFLGGLLARRIALMTVMLCSQGTMVALALVALVASGGPAPGSPAAIWGALAGVAQAAGVASLFHALAIGRMGIVAPLSALAVVVPLTAGIAQGETLTATAIGGIVIAIVGSVLASGPELGTGDPAARRSSRASIVLALVAALSFGASQTLVAAGSAADIPTTLASSTASSFACLLAAAGVLALRSRRRVGATDAAPGGAPQRAAIGTLLLACSIGVLNLVSNAVFGWASTAGPLALLAVLAALYPVVTALLARLVLGERLLASQRAGSLLVVVAVALLAWPAGGVS